MIRLDYRNRKRVLDEMDRKPKVTDFSRLSPSYYHVKAKVAVRRYLDRPLAIFHSPIKLATYDMRHKEIKPNTKVIAKFNATKQFCTK